MSTLYVDSIQPKTTGGNVTITNQANAGKVLQVVSGSLTTQSVAISNSWYDLVTLNITPVSVNSKILIMGSIQFDTSSSSTSAQGSIRVMKGSTNIGYSSYLSESARLRWAYPYQFLDSPNSALQQTYILQIIEDSGTVVVNQESGITTLTLMEIGG